MSAKANEDKNRPGYPWTARQTRQKKARRLARKQARRLSRNL